MEIRNSMESTLTKNKINIVKNEWQFLHNYKEFNKGNSLLLLVGVQTSTVTVEISVENPHGDGN